MKKIIPFTPRWGAVPGCNGRSTKVMAVLVIKKYFPMLAAEHEFDDLLQEAYLIYMKVKRDYPHIDNQKWFLKFFTICLKNRLINMAAKCGRTVSLEALEEDGGLPEMAVLENAFERVTLAELPEQVKQLVYMVCFGPEAMGREAFRLLKQYLPLR